MTSLSLFTFMHWRRKWQPTPVFLPGESQGWGAWWAAVYGVAQSRTRLKQLSSSSSSSRQSYTCLADFLLPMKKRLLSTFPPHSASWPTLGPFCVALCGMACPPPLWNCNKLSFQCQLSPDLLASPYLNNNKTYLFTFYLLLSDWKNYKT